LIGLAMNAFLGRIDLSPGAPALRFSLVGFAVAFGVYLALYAIRAMGAGDVKLMAAVGTMVGWEDWFGIFVITAIIGGAMALILIVAKKRFTSTFMNVGVILNEAKSGRPAYLAKEELDVKNPKALGLPHGAVIAVGTLFYLAFAAHFTK
jgi:prepilin peptidase CpaA